MTEPIEDLAPYRFAEAGTVQTPALLIYPDLVRHNIRTTVGLLGGDPDRWRPHVKTAKLAGVIAMIVEAGVEHVKCATTLELVTACAAGARDVLVAYPAVGARAARVIEIARAYPGVRVSALVEDRVQVAQWTGSGVGLFIDVNPGMDRTGLSDERIDDHVALVRSIRKAGVEFRGLHDYDGHLGHVPASEAERTAHAGYRRLLALAGALESASVEVGEVITAGTPALPWSLSFQGFARAGLRHRVSPGTVVFGDMTSTRQLPAAYGFRSAALVLSTVVSRPLAGRITCDAGHKTVSADAGVPTCEVVGLPGLLPRSPSEEHLPVDVADGTPVPAIGDVLYLRPRHVCPTVNNFDHAVMVSGGRILGVERVTARGREAPVVP
jgi:D-serine deaminase-like pyridoxal phosphate-dependent protein